MKLSVKDFEAKVFDFLHRVAKTPKEGLNRFGAGLAMFSQAKAIEDAIVERADSDGMIDAEELKKLVYAGFDASDGEIKITIGHPLLKLLGAEPERVRITREDADRFFAGL